MHGVRAGLRLLIGAWVQCALIVGAVANEPPAASPGDAKLTFTGTVLLPDAAPAVGATVVAHSLLGEPAVSAVTDEAGRFELRGEFGAGTHVHARSADQTLQFEQRISADAARSVLAQPMELRLAPGQSRQVTVVAGEKPVEGAQVAMRSRGIVITEATNAEGMVTLYSPAELPIAELVAWHPELGIDGFASNTEAVAAGRLSLRPSAPLVVRFVGPDGHSVPNVRFAATATIETGGKLDWIITRDVAAASMQADARGEHQITWFPRDELVDVEIDLLESDWKLDEVDTSRLAERQVTVRVRPKQLVHGRAIVPPGGDCRGVLVTGRGMSGGSYSDIVTTRLRADGTFALRVCSDHGYVLGVMDREWGSDLWSSSPVASGEGAAQPIELRLEPATPLLVRVTRGMERQPAAGAALHVARDAKVRFVDAAGRRIQGDIGPSAWVYTDGQGVARLGLGHGAATLRVVRGDWDETRTVDVDSQEPIEMEFHRPWFDVRHMTGRLLLDGKPWSPPKGLVVKTWVDRDVSNAIPELQADGKFSIDFNDEKLALLFVDQGSGLSGYAKLGDQELAVDVTMQPMATFRGTLVDDRGRPIANRTLKLRIDETGEVMLTANPTGAAGEFEFVNVPGAVPVCFSLDEVAGGAEYSLPRGTRLFLPGEVREGVELTALGKVAAPSLPAPVRPLTERIASSCQFTGTSHMYTLVVCKGDGSPDIKRLVDAMLDYEFEPILPYLPLIVEARQLRSERETVEKLGWPLPEAGQVALVALDRDRQAVAAVVIDAGGNDALAAAKTFLVESKPPVLDAVELLAQARREAQASGRRVWLALGGPRCGPCFRLAAWMDDQRELLKKDYVMVKVIGGLDTRVEEALGRLPYERHGIPWHCITEPDGKLLITSEGPLGNIGMPATIEDFRHLRLMMETTAQSLTADEIQSLVDSIESGN